MKFSFCVAAFLALLCGHSTLCWHGDGHNCGEFLYCQRGKERNIHESTFHVLILFNIHNVLTLHVCVVLFKLLFSSCYLQCLKSMLDFVGLNGKTTVFSCFPIELYVTCMYRRLNMYSVLLFTKIISAFVRL